MCVKIIIPLLAIALLAACGNKNGSYYTTPTGTLGSSNASTVKAQLATAAKISFTTPGEVAVPTRTSYPSSCFTQDPATKVDADGDGIALKSVYTFNCTNTAFGDRTYTMKGTFTEVDKDDSVGSNHAGGWHYDIDYNWNFAPGSGTSGSGIYALKGFFDLAKGSASNYVYSSNFQNSFSGSASPTRATTYAVIFGSTWNHTITPDDVTAPTKSGAVTFSGFWGYKVNVSTRADANSELVVQGSSTGLKYDETCTNFYKEGTITFKAGTGTMTMAYGCNTATVVKLDGTAI